jgi:hypothetical protein
MWDSSALSLLLSIHPTHLAVNIGGIPYLAKNERDTRISCTRHQATATCAAFIEESRMKFLNANNFTGNPGIWGTQHLLRVWEKPWSTSRKFPRLGSIDPL